jgi:dihydroorotate dehydrogenase
MPDPLAVARPLLHALEAETAHRVTIAGLRLGLGPRWTPPDEPLLRQRLWGLEFRTPLGLAAGFDKNAEVPGAMAALGFGFVEVGTVTPRPQAGNPRPRLFRLAADEAVINRMGFNNAGAEAMRRQLEGWRRRPVPLAINIGANKDSEDRAADYAAGARLLAPLADLLVVNVSSPNTPGLRDLQARSEVEALLAGVRAACEAAGAGPPVLLKIAPDLDDAALADVVEGALAGGADGMIVSNTTVGGREALRDRRAVEAGGLSGRPLFALSTERLGRTFALLEGRLPLIGVGGVDSAEAAYAKIRHGASLVQLYSALVYHGPALVRRITEGLAERLRADGFASIGEAVGCDVGR